MNRNTKLVKSLVDDLEPVSPMTRRRGGALVVAALIATIAGLAVLAQFRPGLSTGQLPAIYIITNGLLLVLGISSAAAAVSMASPRVGTSYQGPKWGLAALALLPLSAILSWIAPLSESTQLYHGAADWHCVVNGSASAGLIALALLFWLRRGAPVSPKLAGLYWGLASGSLGMASYGLVCPVDELSHLGIWHIIPVVALGALGRVLGPKLLRW